jgi:hypothetical protein
LKTVSIHHLIKNLHDYENFSQIYFIRTFFSTYNTFLPKGSSIGRIGQRGPFKISELAGNWEAIRAYFRDGNMNSIDVVVEGDLYR